MVILGFLVFFAIGGALLYLPFFLWFRYRRPKHGQYAQKVVFTPAGWAILAAQLIAMFGGIVVADQHPDSAFATLVHGNTGALKWWVCITIVFSAINLLVKQVGLATERQPEPVDAKPAEKPAADPPASRKLVLGRPDGLQIVLQRSFLVGGLFLALIAGSSIEGAIGYCVAYAALFAFTRPAMPSWRARSGCASSRWSYRASADSAGCRCRAARAIPGSSIRRG